jgi:hypothetical protein
MVAAAVTEMQDYVIGRSAGDIEDMFQILYRVDSIGAVLF